MLEIILAIVIIWLALTYLPIPSPLRTIIGIVAGIAILFWLLNILGVA